MKATQDLLERAKNLPLAERTRLVEALLDTIDAIDAEHDQKWREEAAARLRAFRDGELTAVDQEEVLNPKRS